MILLIFICLFLQFPKLIYSFDNTGCFARMKKSVFMDGNVVLAAIFPIYTIQLYFSPSNPKGALTVLLFKPRNYQFVLSMLFAIEEINKNPHILPNISLGYDIYNIRNTDYSPMDRLFWWLTGMGKWIPNYTCTKEKKSIAAIIGPTRETSIQSGAVLDLYKIPQMAPTDTFLIQAMISLMVHFKWNWVGLFILNDYKGVQILSDFRREMERNRICIAFVEMFLSETASILPKADFYYRQIIKSSANVIIIYGDPDSLQSLLINIGENLMTSKVWVLNSKYDAITTPKEFMLDTFHGNLIFSHHHEEVPGSTDFFRTVSPSKYPNDTFLLRVWHLGFRCPFSKSDCEKLENCPLNASLELMPGHKYDMTMSEESYNIYNAVHAVAHALHAMLLQQVETEPLGNVNGLEISPWKLNHFLKNMYFNNLSCGHVILDGQRQCDEQYDILNSWNFPQSLSLKVKVGTYSQFAPYGQQLSLHEDLIEWAMGITETPRSICTESCGPGFMKTHMEGKPVCCFECIPCPVNEISNETDMDQCLKCGDYLYANKHRNKCIPKVVTFLSYDDPLGMTLACTALCFSSLTASILGVFVKLHNTPIVKANNRNLSYILLISLIFCFLCSLLFIGHPNTCTCILQQTTFGVVFTVALSTVLAKTITVLLAFKLTVPGRRMRWLLGTRIPNLIIPICTLIQLLFCGIWLGISPPFVDLDTQSEFEHLLIVCNKGSVTAFYCVLGFLGSLALVSFTVAFLVKILPDTFNEAKFLTFSMLVFCSVWITFVPVYHSTKGKAMIATEIFSILASSAGLLGCIFLPKCYIIFLRPEKNCRCEHRNKKLCGWKKPS